MKTITKLCPFTAAIVALGNSKKRFGAFLIFISMSVSVLLAVPAQQYCHKAITATDGVTTLYLTASSLGSNKYEFKLESDVAMTGFNPNTLWMHVNGAETYQFSLYLTLSTDGKTLSTTITSTAPPSIYSNIMFVTYPGEKRFDLPSDIDWTATCSAGPADTEIPTVFSATKGSVTATTVELLLIATDNSGSINYTVSYGTTPTIVTTTGTSAIQKSLIISNLTQGTDYIFSVTAKDATGNSAANNPQSVSATTSAFVAATTPTKLAANVKSIYSDAYTPAATVSAWENWWDMTFSDYTFTASENAKKIIAISAAGNCGGANFAATPLDISNMTNLHIDVYPTSSVGVGLKLVTIAHGESAGWISLGTLIPNQWNSKDILLSDFGIVLTDLKQVGFASIGGSGTFYMDNLYFFNTSGPDTQIPTDFTAKAGTITSDAIELLLKASDNSGSINYTISYGSVPTVVTTSGGSGTQKSFTVSGLTALTAYSFSVTAMDATGNAALNNPITFQATTTAPMPAASTPSHLASKVISLYSDTYTSSAITWDNWGSASVLSEVVLGTNNNTKKFVSFGWYGMNFSAIDISAMTTLHIDVYPTTESIVKLSPIGGGETLVTLNVVANQWNSIDIPLTQFPGVSNKTAVTQFKFADGTGGTFFMDNLYFYNDQPTGLKNIEDTPVLSCYPNPIVNKLTISSQSEIKDITIRNLIGQSIQSVVVNEKSKTIDLSSLASGNYFIVAKMGNGSVTTHKFIKL